jgi:hypothetical protein
MTRALTLYGLDEGQSFILTWRLLFSPALTQQIGLDRSLAWCERLIEGYLGGPPEEFVQTYEWMAAKVREVTKDTPRPSLSRPPWAMVSLEMHIGLLPWLTPDFGKFLWITLSREMAVVTPFGRLLAVAFILYGGPGDTKETAFRVTAPNQGARASAEHWLMLAYLHAGKMNGHATLMPDAKGRQFSMHFYVDREQVDRKIFFETTSSFGREEEDFLEFLQVSDEKKQIAPLRS